MLCLDAGNSRLKFGLGDGEDWSVKGALDYDALDDLLPALPSTPERVVACNVAGEAVRQRITGLAQTLSIPLDWLHSSAAICGVRNGYDRPAQLGADRWAALIGARRRHAGAAVVVLAGTATTIDMLDASGLFRGGLILPGLRLMGEALARNTAGLPNAAGRYRACPTNTDDAISGGAIHATLGAIQRIHAGLGADALCLLSGGAAEVLTPHLDLPCRTMDDLVLCGLACYARRGG